MKEAFISVCLMLLVGSVSYGGQLWTDAVTNLKCNNELADKEMPSHSLKDCLLCHEESAFNRALSEVNLSVIRRKEIVDRQLVARQIGTLEAYWDIAVRYGQYEECGEVLAELSTLIEATDNKFKLFDDFMDIHPNTHTFVPERFRLGLVGPKGFKVYEIADLKHRGFSDELIAEKILASTASYKNFSFDEAIELRQLGFSDSLTAAMIKSTNNAAQIAEQELKLAEQRKRQEEQEALRQQQLAQDKSDSGNTFLKAMAIGLGAVAIGSANIPTDVAVDAISSLATDVMLETGGTNSMDFNQRMANRTSASSASTSMAARSGDSKKTRQISFTCPSGVKFNSPFEYRTETCFSAAENFARVSACNESNMAIVQSQQRCKAACGREDCYEQ